MSDRVLASDALTVDLGPELTWPIATLGGLEVGLWEMAPGTAEDTEVDEVCLMLAGRGTVTFEDGEVVDLVPGVAVQLRAGERTTWVVTETLRKVYVSR
jgi:uncharacterized cupin superfamily protein